MLFEDAFKKLRGGQRIHRESWTDQWLRMTTDPRCIYLDFANESPTTWAPSQPDILAEDWVILYSDRTEFCGPSPSYVSSQINFERWVNDNYELIDPQMPFLAFVPALENPVGLGATLTQALEQLPLSVRDTCFVGHFSKTEHWFNADG